ncbi:MAG: PIN domain-containing protein [Acidobacteria bacterium]|nr:PIN domain-containing protein [Acidobacteriota bacterium]
MSDSRWGPFLFDTSAESWFARTDDPRALKWWRAYLGRNAVSISAVTVLERVRGYARLWRTADSGRRELIESARVAYLQSVGKVLPIDAATALVAGEILALVAEPPTPPKRSHRVAESRSERLARWRFDGIIAATAMVAGMTLIHNNPGDFEAIRGGVERNPERFPGVGPLNLMRCGAIVV